MVSNHEWLIIGDYVTDDSAAVKLLDMETGIVYQTWVDGNACGLTISDGRGTIFDHRNQFVIEAVRSLRDKFARKYDSREHDKLNVVYRRMVALMQEKGWKPRF